MKKVKFLLVIFLVITLGSENLYAQIHYDNGLSHKHQQVLQVNSASAGATGFLTCTTCDGDKICISRKAIDGTTNWDMNYEIDLGGGVSSAEVNALSVNYAYKSPDYNFVVTGSYLNGVGENHLFIFIIDENGSVIAKNSILSNHSNPLLKHLYGLHVFQNNEGGYVVSGVLSSEVEDDWTDTREILVVKFDADLMLEWGTSWNTVIGGQSGFQFDLVQTADFDMATFGKQLNMDEYIITGSRAITNPNPAYPPLKGVLALNIDRMTGSLVADNSFYTVGEHPENGADIMIDYAKDRYYILSNKQYEHTFSITAFDKSNDNIIPTECYDAYTYAYANFPPCEVGSAGYTFGHKLYRDPDNADNFIVSGVRIAGTATSPFVMSIEEKSPRVSECINIKVFEDMAANYTNLGNDFFSLVNPKFPNYDPANYFMKNTSLGLSESRILTLVPDYDTFGNKVDNKIITHDYEGNQYGCTTTLKSLFVYYSQKTKQTVALNETPNVVMDEPLEINPTQNATSEVPCGILFNGYTGIGTGGGGSHDLGWRKASTNNADLSGITNEKIKNLPLAVSPNPSSGETLISGLTLGLANISIQDISGKVIYEFNGKVSDNHTIDLSEFKTGIYILQITQEGETHSLKLIKE